MCVCVLWRIEKSIWFSTQNAGCSHFLYMHNPFHIEYYDVNKIPMERKKKKYVERNNSIFVSNFETTEWNWLFSFLQLFGLHENFVTIKIICECVMKQFTIHLTQCSMSFVNCDVFTNKRIYLTAIMCGFWSLNSFPSIHASSVCVSATIYGTHPISISIILCKWTRKQPNYSFIRIRWDHFTHFWTWINLIRV